MESFDWLVYETTERNDQNNWVKQQLLASGLEIVEFEGYTIKDSRCTGLFDRRLFLNHEFLNFTDLQVFELIRNVEPHLESKLKFAKMLDVHYRYVFYSYELNLIKVYRVYSQGVELMREYNNFCRFIQDSMALRDLNMSSAYEEDQLPEIDRYFRDVCGIPWMGNLDALFITRNSKNPRLLVEFQTTKKASVANHCNNKYFTRTQYRKGDEQRWKVFDLLSQQARLDLAIIVWSPNEIGGNIKYKIVDQIVYSDDSHRRSPGIRYKQKTIENIDSLKNIMTQIGVL
ncbi:hypothetical protein AAEU28_02030 [Pseudoalteromonas sp. SS15]|uniref:hypothetical protein n=1 Tax=Pseudoalteromonas sp. SS15 TaxID=3139393 RepID=UPI003BAB61C8